MEERDRQQILDDLGYLIEMQDAAKLRTIALSTHPAEVAEVLRHLDWEHRHFFFLALNVRTAAQVVLELDEDTRRELVESLDDRQVAELAGEMPSDDAADFVGELPEERAARVLAQIEPKESAEVRQLLAHEEDTAGGIMALELVAVREGSSVADAIAELRRKADEVKHVLDLYVVNAAGKLVGTVSLKDLILADPLRTLRDIMNPEFVAVETGTDQEAVANKVRKYDLLAVPVVDAQGRLVGCITHDDIVDVIQEEANEDLSRMAGIAGPPDPIVFSVFHTVRVRLPWLVIGLLGGIIAAMVLSFFEDQLEHDILVLMFFVPVVMAMGGNAGIQSSTIVVHGLATGRINLGGILSRLFNEMRVAFLNGSLCGLVIWMVIWVFWGEFRYGLVVGASLLLVMFVAALVGATVPLVLKRLDVDPAIATGPFITISNDILGLCIYLGVATLYYDYWH